MLIQLFLILTGLYVAGVGYLLYHWKRIGTAPVQQVDSSKLQISVVIVIRNEEKNIAAILNDLALQNLNKKVFEVIVVNDHSTDQSCSRIEGIAPGLPFAFRLLHSAGKGKKAGLELGIKQAKGKIIAVTDGDCRLGKNWLLALLNVFQFKKAVFVSGPVTFSGERNLFERLQTIEFASLVGSGAALLKAGKPGMCNAANMAFLKEVFEEVKGFEANRHIPSGDDGFLLQAIYKRYPEKVLYLKNPEAVVETSAQENWQSFFHQRKRWAGKWRLHKSWWVAATAGAVFLFHASWVLLIFLILSSRSMYDMQGVAQPIVFFFVATMVKFGSEFLFLQFVLGSMGKKLLPLPFLALQLLYPFYVMFFGIAANFGSFTWKERTYKYTNT